ncbi:hypothetical protein LZP73_06050 [Shewanella sp. AS16]|uniref:hypothetical protein n=1 Tax=Shewanella sp. AS16 TaxID=2907625 RepID=UPI001F218A1A|nr:hypothetical protein [Shewanella sp. AS16]MCE9685779.1 hypothetical protein [Shewanella sp. AS16]
MAAAEHDPREPSQYDLHRLVIYLILLGTSLCALGLSLVIWRNYSLQGMALLNVRADTLGDYIASPLAYIFNFTLMISGLCMLLAMLALFSLRPRIRGGNYLAAVACWVGLAIILMGIFPINDLQLHRIVATAYLLGTFCLHCLCVYAGINRSPLCPRPLFYLGIAGLLNALVLMLRLEWRTLDFMPCSHAAGDTCWVAINIWLQTLLTLGWCLLLALAMLRSLRAEGHGRPATSLGRAGAIDAA